MKIPKILFQTSLQPQPEYVLKMLENRAPNWNYKHFTDEEIVRYFIEHPESEFPFIVNRFHQMRFGAHKADLFRYYFLYQNGGVFLDSDAMIEQSLDKIVLEYEMFSVKSYIEGTVFQGFIGCVPRHPTLHKALIDAYQIDIEILTQNYHLLTKNMCSFFIESDRRKLYREGKSDGEKAITVDDAGSPILTHYWKDKVIPDVLYDETNIRT
jgi:mannosyltransferase OCH1-like enzyme